jgi:hypothetical protein
MYQSDVTGRKVTVASSGTMSWIYIAPNDLDKEPLFREDFDLCLLWLKRLFNVKPPIQTVTSLFAMRYRYQQW